MRASVGTGPAAGVADHSRRWTASVVSGSNIAASAARLPASPASDFSATNLDVADAGSSPSGGCRRAVPVCGGPATAAVPTRCAPRVVVDSSRAMRRSAASAQSAGGARVPHMASAPPAPRTSASQSSAAARTAGCESGDSNLSASPLPATRASSVLTRAVPPSSASRRRSTCSTLMSAAAVGRSSASRGARRRR
eukprot:2302592-Pleurochrysis_carterae.AAC.1